MRLCEEPYLTCGVCEKYFLQNACLIAHISLTFRPCSEQRILFWPGFRKELRIAISNEQFKQNRRMKKHIQECDGHVSSYS